MNILFNDQIPKHASKQSNDEKQSASDFSTKEHKSKPKYLEVIDEFVCSHVFLSLRLDNCHLIFYIVTENLIDMACRSAKR